MDNAERAQVVSDFILASPPGEIIDVFNDVRAILNDEEFLQDVAVPSFRTYNEKTLQPTFLEDDEVATVISKYAVYEVDEETNTPTTYLNPRTSTKFAFDHIIQKPTEQEAVEIDASSTEEEGRKAVESAADKYIAEHFKDGASSTFVNKEAADSYIVTIVNNKFNPSNYWNGRWTAVYNLNAKTGAVQGDINTLVHYYEEGNVQLNVNKNIKLEVATDEYNGDVRDFAVLAFKEIKAQEAAFQQALNEKFQHLSDTSFKQLRRVLPVTRNKINWEAITNYKIGNELSR